MSVDPSAYLEHLGRGADIESVDAGFVDWVSSVGLDGASRDCFALGWVEPGGMIGAGFPMSAREIVVMAESEPRWLDSGFLVIGSCGNGDPVALDLRASPGAVCFLNHEVLWSDGDADPRSWCVVVATDLDAFVRTAWDLDTFPVDYWDARSHEGR